MKVESESSMFKKSIIFLHCKTTKDIEKYYNVKVHLPNMKTPVDYMFMVSGEWDNMAKFDKDKVTLIK